MRRKDREITDRQEMLDIMGRCDVCRLALNGSDGYPLRDGGRLPR